MSKLKIHDALNEVERDRWQCETCTDPAQEDDTMCVSCRLYWQDVRDGLFDYDEPAIALSEGGR